ncbi:MULTISPECIES: DNA methyltransferase [Spirulina sp. CCY15215]|uniref:DNA methyltransferase n=1 Tax=Spirulina sp. CCY15215 TaxID=2767591 RepID=UPI0019512AF4|nr:DNA methyltransferase [Spirulina major]
MTKGIQLELFSTPDLLTSSSKGATKEKWGSFTNNMKLPLHRWFRYSAGFSATWVEKVLLEKKPQTVLDPFVGSGTVCVACDRYSINSYGVESHPFVYRLACGKLHWYSTVSEFLDTIAEIKNIALKIDPVFPENIPKLLNQCYTEENLQDLWKIKEAYLTVAQNLSEGINDLVFLAISAILRPTSYVGTAQWQYILPNKRKAKVLNPFIALDYQVQFMREDMEKMQDNVRNSHANLLKGDARTLATICDRSIDFVLTSPPYANNYDYADATRLEMTFWGEVNNWGDLHELVRRFLVRSSSQHVSKDRLCLDLLLAEPIIESINNELSSVCQTLAQVRLTKGGRKKYHTMIAAYFLDMGRVLRALYRVTKSDSQICMVIGDSAPYGVYVPVEKWLGKLAVASGFTSWSFEKIRDRNIKWKNRKHTVPLQEGILWINR